MREFFKRLFRQPITWLVLASLIYMAPMLFFPTFNYIDDGQTLLTGKTLMATSDLSTWRDSFIEYPAGRLRPGYQLYLLLMYVLFDTQPFGYWLMQTVVIALTLIGIFTFIKQTSKAKDWLAAGVATLFLLLPAAIENLYRLGTAEPRQALFMIWFLVWLSKLKLAKFNWQSFMAGQLLLLMTLTTKETSLMVLPMIGVYFFRAWWPKRQLGKVGWLYFLSLMIQPILFFFALPSRQGYTANVDISLSKLWYGALVTRFNWAEYYFPMVVGLILLLLRGVKSLERGKLIAFLKTLQWPLTLLAGFVGSLFFVFSWEHQLERYHYLTFVFIILFLFVESNFYDWSKK